MGNFFDNLGKGLNDLGKEAGKFAENIGQELGKATDNIVKEGTKVADNVGKAAGDIGKGIEDATKQSSEISQGAMMGLLDWSYEQVIQGLPGEKGIYVLVDEYLSKYDREIAIEKLIQFQTTKAATSGFVTGFGGLLTMPVTLPANMTSVLLFQMRMIAAIALMRGYDLHDDQVQTFVYATLAGTSVSEIVKKAGIEIGNKLALSVVRKIPGRVLTKINKAVGFRLATKFGTKGAINIGKMIPVVGAVVGGAFDAGSTVAIANFAKSTFTEIGIDCGDGVILTKSMMNVKDVSEIVTEES